MGQHEYPIGFAMKSAASEFFTAGKAPNKEYMDFLCLCLRHGDTHFITALFAFATSNPTHCRTLDVFSMHLDVAIANAVTRTSEPFLIAAFTLERRLLNTKLACKTLSFYAKWMRYSQLLGTFGTLVAAIANDIPFFVVEYALSLNRFFQDEAHAVRNAIARDTENCSVYIDRLQKAHAKGDKTLTYLLMFYLEVANIVGVYGVLQLHKRDGVICGSVVGALIHCLFSALRARDDFCVVARPAIGKLLSFLDYETLSGNALLHKMHCLSDWPDNGLILYRILDRMSVKECVSFVGEISMKTKSTAMHELVRRGCVMGAKVLLGYQRIPMDSWFVPDANGRTPIHWAAMCKHAELLHLFLANVSTHTAEVKDSFGVTARAYASRLFRKTTDFSRELVCDSESIGMEDAFMED